MRDLPLTGPSGLCKLQLDSFYNQFNLSMRSYILSLSRQYIPSYISSPEVNFLTSISGRVGRRTKLVFRFLDESTLEPSMNKTYGSILKNLTFIKTFASGILSQRAIFGLLHQIIIYNRILQLSMMLIKLG